MYFEMQIRGQEKDKTGFESNWKKKVSDKTR